MFFTIKLVVEMQELNLTIPNAYIINYTLFKK